MEVFQPVTNESLDLAERLAKLPGATIGDVRAAAGLPRLDGLQAYVNDIVLNMPFWDSLWTMMTRRGGRR